MVNRVGIANLHPHPGRVFWREYLSTLNAPHICATFGDQATNHAARQSKGDTRCGLPRAIAPVVGPHDRAALQPTRRNGEGPR
jgi:hypothetical protein